MSSKPERLRLIRSLSLRLSLLYAGLFGVGIAAAFVVVYVLLARTLQQREQEVLEVRAAEYANVLEQAGPEGLKLYIDQDQEPYVRSLFVRVLGSNGQVFNIVKAPPEWHKEGPVTMVPNNWGFWRPQRSVTVQIPRDEYRDLTVVSRALAGGLLLQVARTTDNRAVFLEPLRRTMWIAGPIAVFLAGALGAWVSWRSIRPVRLVAMTARQIIATGDLSRVVPATKRNDEVGELVEQFNTLLERNHNLLRAMREALDNVAHDVRTPLTRLRAGAEAALQGGDTAVARDALADCVEETDRIRALLDALLDISAAEAGVLSLKQESVDVQSLLESVAELYSIVAEDKSITVSIYPAAGVAAWADPTRLRQVVANLVDNAIKYTPDHGAVLLGVERRGDSAIITVRDTGPGISAGEQDKIWRRLYRADASRSQRGLGLGLSVVKAVIEAHGGNVSVMNHAQGGAVFTVELPASEPARPAVATATLVASERKHLAQAQ